jgi:hypothetical protein
VSDLPDSRHDLGSVRPSRWTDQPDVKRRARLEVARRATGVEDCRRLLSMLGLAHSAEEVAAFKRSAVNDTVIQAVDETGDLQ